MSNMLKLKSTCYSTVDQLVDFDQQVDQQLINFVDQLVDQELINLLISAGNPRALGPKS